VFYLFIEIYEYLQYVRCLNFYENPNYNYLRNIFENALLRNGFENDLSFDWVDKIKMVLIQNVIFMHCI